MNNYGFLTRIIKTLSPKKSLEALRATALSEWEVDFEKGRADHEAGIDSMHRRFYEFLTLRLGQLSKNGTKEVHPYVLECTRIFGWAVHLMPAHLYDRLHLLTSQDNDAHAIACRIEAEHAVKGVRVFPEIEARRRARARRQPTIESVDERERKTAWRNSAPLITVAAPAGEIADFVGGLNADDLHELVCGATEREDNVFVFPVAAHPLCDRGTALMILSGGAAAWQAKWRDGAREDDQDPAVQPVFQMWARVSARLNQNDFRTNRFLHNLEIGFPRDSDGHLSVFHPTHWLKWRLEDHAIAPTDDERHRPGIVFDCGRVRQSYDVWKRLHAGS